jgi:solute carrier family 13 (sodium-dependent dicarboxylate transporter), member 2/3/5
VTETIPPRPAARLVLLVAGPILAVVLAALAPESLSPAAAAVLGIAAWMALWWITEPVPLAATSLLPIALFPILGITSVGAAAAPYANEIVFLFLAGFLLAAALERWNAHARIAYGMVAAIGVGTRRVILGVMIATAFLSLWISNTATAAMMYPIVLAIGALFGEGDDAARMRTALMLGMAYAASIGGMGTLIGTPPNLVFAGAARELLGREIGFVQYMAIGIPIVVVLLPLCWALLVFVLFRSRVVIGAEARGMLDERRRALGPLGGGEALTVGIFALTALAWFVREPKLLGAVRIPGLTDLAPRLGDAAIGVAGAILLFVVTGRDRDGARRPLLVWDEARRIPWEVLLLFGGGLSLADAMQGTGVAAWLAELMSGLAGLPTPIIYAGLALIVVVLSEIASNTATATMAMPVAASLAVAVGGSPLALMLVAALAASAGFALPVATPPNTIVFGSGQVTVRQMMRAGLWLDAIGIVVVVTIVSALFGVVFGG